MKKNYTDSSSAGERGVSMKTKLLLAKIGLAICIIILIVAKSFMH